MRKLGPRGWTIEDMRRFITLWIENVSTRCIVAAIGRSNGSLYSKRKRLGLEPRRRGELQERSPEACAATPVSWLPKPLIDAVKKPLRRIAGMLQNEPKAKPEDRWTPERGKYCSYLAFAGLSNSAIAIRLTQETGISFSPKAVADQLSRMMAFRDRTKKAVETLPEEEIIPRAESFIALWLLQWRICEGTGHHFWYSRVRGGPRKTCREFWRAKFAKKRQERDCAAHFVVA
ncbi:hypothetical protein CCR94_02300 [Rhodoblastus sphagnicola]|uniref:Uncharacterized protein n=2 Tax=Rhodoblastus sphagnicola TaxID=333368 RepID=A0A2S6NF61_9HYPH|nr:hypothetical protein CCR94_02300 [Rhodoblastus sphagnicola]